MDLHTLAEGGTVVVTSERKVVKIDPKNSTATWGSSIGAELLLKNTREGDRFMTQATGQDRSKHPRR